jgi:alpha-galactosidase
MVNGTTTDEEPFLLQNHTGDGVSLQYRVPETSDAVFHLEVVHAGADAPCWLHYWIEKLPSNFVLDSFGIRFEALENLDKFLRSGYFSWDGSFYVQPEHIESAASVPKLEQGYALTQLLPLNGYGSVVIGFDRHDRFQHLLTLDRATVPYSLKVETLWDRSDRSTDNVARSERLVIFEHSEVENALRRWANIVAEASPTPPRLTAPAITGWCSWYNLYANITEENILQHLRGTAEVVRRENLPMRVFQIDDGFTPEMGDWLDVKPQFPRGIKPLLDDIRAEGFIPGLWIAPFMVGNRSSLYAEHPDWVVKDRVTGSPLTHMRFYAEFRWHKRSEEYYILDATRPEALDYLRRVFRVWRYEWGCEYFKTDFMHFGSEYGPDRAKWHEEGLSRMQIWRRVAEMIRQEIGDAFWLGCGFPLWAAVGLVDGVRIGRDMGVEWAGNYSAQSLLRDQAARNFANHILWQSDPDCILLRERYHYLSDVEVQSLAVYAGMSGGLVMTSDALDALSEERLHLWKRLLNPQKSVCSYPLLGMSSLIHRLDSQGVAQTQALEPVLVQVRTPIHEPGHKQAAVFILNTGEKSVQRCYSLEQLNLPSRMFVFDRSAPTAVWQPVDKLAVTLAPRDGVLFFLSAGNNNPVPEILP